MSKKFERATNMKLTLEHAPFASSKISCASLTNEMEGSLRLKSAHDLDLKLIPWKQATEMWLPRSSSTPPSTDPDGGSAEGKV